MQVNLREQKYGVELNSYLLGKNICTVGSSWSVYRGNGDLITVRSVKRHAGGPIWLECTEQRLVIHFLFCKSSFSMNNMPFCNITEITELFRVPGENHCSDRIAFSPSRVSPFSQT